MQSLSGVAGRQFGRILIVSQTPTIANSKNMWICYCSSSLIQNLNSPSPLPWFPCSHGAVTTTQTWSKCAALRWTTSNPSKWFLCLSYNTQGARGHSRGWYFAFFFPSSLPDHGKLMGKPIRFITLTHTLHSPQPCKHYGCHNVGILVLLLMKVSVTFGK